MELGAGGTSAVLKNISRSGLACISYSQVPEMTMVEMKIQLPALPEEEVDQYDFACKGAVVRCESVNRSSSKKKWLVAVYFTDMDDENRRLLEQYLTVRS
jgi:hypothetical protein